MVALPPMSSSYNVRDGSASGIGHAYYAQAAQVEVYPQQQD